MMKLTLVEGIKYLLATSNLVIKLENLDLELDNQNKYWEFFFVMGQKTKYKRELLYQCHMVLTIDIRFEYITMRLSFILYEKNWIYNFNSYLIEIMIKSHITSNH